MSVNFLHLRSFFAVASERSVSKAARRLNISQPTLSKQLKALEDRYQTKLIEGSRPPLTLTPTGKVLYSKAEQLFGLADEIGVLLGEDDINSEVLVRLGTDSPPYAAEFMTEFCRVLPSARFRVTIANAVQTNDLLLQAQIDLGIICEPTIQNEYTYVPLYSDRLVAIVPAAWENVPERLPIDRLGRETLLVRESTSRTLAAVNRLLAETGVVPGRLMEFHTREMIREGVAHGLGMSLMFARECPPDARIRTLPIDTDTPTINVVGYLAVRTERKRMPIFKLAFEVAEAMREAANSPQG